MILHITLPSPSLYGTLVDYQNLRDRLLVIDCLKLEAIDNNRHHAWIHGTHVTLTDHGDSYTIEYSIEINDQLTLKAGRETRYDAGLIDIHADLNYIRRYWLQADKYPTDHMIAYGFDNITRVYYLTKDGIGVRYHDPVSSKKFNCNKPPTFAALAKRIERARAN